MRLLLHSQSEVEVSARRTLRTCEDEGEAGEEAETEAEGNEEAGENEVGEGRAAKEEGGEKDESDLGV